MGILDELRVDIGDDGDLILPSGSPASTPQVQTVGQDMLLLMRDLRVDVADDEDVNFPSGIQIGSLPTTSIIGNSMLEMLRDIRVDVADDEDYVYPSGATSGSLPNISVVGPSIALLLRDVRVDIGDDEGLDFADISGIFPSPVCPQVWCTTIVVTPSYDTTNEDVILFVSRATSGPVTINLAHTPILGQLIIIKDLKGDANTNNITVNPSPYMIDSLTAFKLTQDKQSIMITWSGTEWNIV